MNVPSELEGIAYIQVLIQKESAQLVTANLSHMGAFPGSEAPDQHWQRKLEAAQNVLFCKELFSQLAKEAISLQESDGLILVYQYTVGRPVIRKVLKIRTWGVPPVCLGSR